MDLVPWQFRIKVLLGCIKLLRLVIGSRVHKDGKLQGVDLQALQSLGPPKSNLLQFGPLSHQSCEISGFQLTKRIL